MGDLSIDIYLPSISVALEVQGEQHYSPIDFFGGEEGFENQIERDNKKIKLCNENNVQLYWLNEEHELKFKDLINKLLEISK